MQPPDFGRRLLSRNPSYFKNWMTFQSRPSLATSTCTGTRFTDNGMTVRDNLTALLWEKKTGTLGPPIVGGNGNPEEVNSLYTLSTSITSNLEDGTAFSSFLGMMNAADFTGSRGWRLPTVAELQSILLDFACAGASGSVTCRCGSTPCIDAAFGVTQPAFHWSATTHVDGYGVWGVAFDAGAEIQVGGSAEPFGDFVRAVRGGF